MLTPCGKLKNILLRNNSAGLSYLLFPLLIFDSKGHYKYTELYIKMRNLGNQIEGYLFSGARSLWADG